MKRRHPSTENESFSPSNANRKRFVRIPPTADLLPCKFKLLRQWELTEEASRFLSIGNKVEEQAISDRTSPQLAVVLYQPTLYQQILGLLDSPSSESFEPEPMEIEEF